VFRFRVSEFDSLVKSQKTPFFVIPAKAGIPSFQLVAEFRTPVFTGVTTFYETIRICGLLIPP